MPEFEVGDVIVWNIPEDVVGIITLVESDRIWFRDNWVSSSCHMVGYLLFSDINNDVKVVQSD